MAFLRKTLFLLAGLLLLLPQLYAQDRLFTLDGEGAGDLFGSSVAGLGDLNGDGLPDFAGGAPSLHGRTHPEGYVKVFSGADGSLLFLLSGEFSGDRFGTSVASPGDLDLDGVPDILVGAPHSAPFGTDSGAVWIFSGRTGTLLDILAGDSSGDDFGFSVSGAGDVDADGFPDFIVGAIQDFTGFGYARVFSGRKGKEILTFTGLSGADRLGYSVSGAGDLDGDGFGDLVVGAPTESVHRRADGGAWLFSGGTGAVLLHLSPAQNSAFGFSVAGLGDLDGDTFPEILVGAPFKKFNGRNLAGEVLVFSFSAGSTLYSFPPGNGLSMLGASVANAGDVDGDGVSDIIAGAPKGDRHSTGLGAAEILSGSDGSFLGEISLPNLFGTSVASTGDVDGDGLDDVIVGAPFDERNGSESGSVRVFSVLPRIDLSAPSPGVAGTSNTMAVQRAGPGNEVLLVGGTDRGGLTLSCHPGKQPVDIETILLRRTRRANGSGIARFQFTPPLKVSGRILRFRALDRDACRLSNLVVFTFP